MNKKDNTKVNLKITPSNPRRVGLVESPPHTLPNPVPLTCNKIKTDRTIETKICKTSNKFIIIVLYHFYFLIQFIKPVKHQIRTEKAR